MRKILITTLLLIGCTSSVNLSAYEYSISEHETVLTQHQRDYIWNQIHFCVKKMNISIDKADTAISKMKNEATRSAYRGAVAGAISGLQTKTGYGVIIGAILTSIGNLSLDFLDCGGACIKHFSDAKYYGDKADQLQESLWRG